MNEVEPVTRRRNWDPLVKLTHWGVVAAVIGNALVTEEGSKAHVWVGYGLAGLLALRLLWGMIGPAEARFSAFPPSPGRAIAHLREIGAGKKTAHASHNPLGALMVYAIWGTLGVVIATGIAMAGLPNASSANGLHERSPQATPEAGSVQPARDRLSLDKAREEEREGANEERLEQGNVAPVGALNGKFHGERAENERSGARNAMASENEQEVEEGEEGDEKEGPLGEVHEAAVNLLYLLIAAHLAGVIFETRRSGREILLAMLPGRR